MSLSSFFTSPLLKPAPAKPLLPSMARMRGGSTAGSTRYFTKSASVKPFDLNVLMNRFVLLNVLIYFNNVDCEWERVGGQHKKDIHAQICFNKIARCYLLSYHGSNKAERERERESLKGSKKRSKDQKVLCGGALYLLEINVIDKHVAAERVIFFGKTHHTVR
jgi:hypothetical protein